MDARLVLMIFNIVIVGLSVVIFVAAAQMKKTKEIPDLFLNAEDMNRIKKGQEGQFAEALYPKAMIFSIICMVTGIIAFLATFFKVTGEQEYIGIIALMAFLLAWSWFTAESKKLKGKFLK
ncbi:MAG TPA: hypothetical protein DCP96_06530 [Lachnospiraceae bacterium]|nr:hypothetical protein [Lachnospiraceae bacterium]HAN51345.1 hypothetical protein [Lachnospiraceae bacterium]HBE07878.1 hypothetical protein [Lachnospiraceae bacterium]